MLTGQSGGTEINAWLIVELTDDLESLPDNRAPSIEARNLSG
jgi:hypothetical protein